MPSRKSVLLAALSGLALLAGTFGARAETVIQALASAYSGNPQINSARAQTRADDENVPIARSGLRPIISAFSTTTGQATDSNQATDRETLDSVVGLQVTQNLFTGFRTLNAIRQSEAGVLASRELLTQHRAERAVRRGAGLYGRAAGRRHPRHPPAQRPLPRRAGARRPTSGSMSARTRAPTWRRRARGWRLPGRRSAWRRPISRPTARSIGASSATIRTISSDGFPFCAPDSARAVGSRRAWAERPSGHPCVHPSGGRAGLHRQADRGRAAADSEHRGPGSARGKLRHGLGSEFRHHHRPCEHPASTRAARSRHGCGSRRSNTG